MYKRPTWREKLADSKDLPKVVKITGRMTKRWGQGTCAIPAPREVDAIMRKVPEGRLITINEIRERVARKHKATMGCPVTTGIFAWIAAHAAEEAALVEVEKDRLTDDRLGEHLVELEVFMNDKPRRRLSRRERRRPVVGV